VTESHFAKFYNHKATASYLYVDKLQLIEYYFFFSWKSSTENVRQNDIKNNIYDKTVTVAYILTS